MSEFVAQLSSDEVVPSEFGIVGVIGLAAQEAMRRHSATVESMGRDPAQAMAAIATQAGLLEGFAARYPEAGWNYASEAELRNQFEQFASERTGE